MKQRFWTGAAMVLILAPLYILGGWFSTILIMVLSYMGTYELVHMYQTKNSIPSVCKFIIPIFSVLMVLVMRFDEPTYYLIYLFVLELMGLFMLPIFNKYIQMKDCIFFIFAIVYSGITFALFEGIRNLERFAFDAHIGFTGRTNWFGWLDIHPVGLILFSFVLVIAMATDIAAYSFGRKLGKHKLCPSISPKKTVEGAIGGAIMGAIVGTLYVVILNYTLPESYVIHIRLFQIEQDWLYFLAIFGIAIIISVISEIGDLVASKLKREYEIKDFGNILPGHGGILDRFDSTILSGLAFYVILVIIGAI